MTLKLNIDIFKTYLHTSDILVIVLVIVTKISLLHTENEVAR